MEGAAPVVKRPAHRLSEGLPAIFLHDHAEHTMKQKHMLLQAQRIAMPIKSINASKPSCRDDRWP